jgi:heptosyltransferase-2
MSKAPSLDSIRPMKIDRTKPLKIFVKGVNWVGDAVISTPALARLRQTFPDAQITVMARPWVAPIYEHNPDITNLWVLDDGGSLGNLWRAVKMIQRERFTIGVALPGSLRAGLLLWLGNVKYRFGYSIRGRWLILNRAVKLCKDYLDEHQLYFYLHIIEEMCGMPAGRQHLVLKPGDLEQEEVRRLLAQLGLDRGQPLVGLAPGSINSNAKRWPADRFAALADRLAEEAHAEVLLLGSMKEADVLDRVAKQCKAKVHNLK